MMMKIPPHPNVLTLLGGITEWKGQPVYWLVMPYVPGGSFADKLKHEPTWYMQCTPCFEPLWTSACFFDDEYLCIVVIWLTCAFCPDSCRHVDVQRFLAVCLVCLTGVMWCFEGRGRQVHGGSAAPRACGARHVCGSDPLACANTLNLPWRQYVDLRMARCVFPGWRSFSQAHVPCSVFLWR